MANLYLALILIGATIGAVLFYLWRQARQISRTNLALIRLNEQLGFDTPAFLQAAWEPLSQAGWRGMAWRLDWFGLPVEGQAGRLDGQSVMREIQVAEMRLAITVFHRGRRGEHRYFDETLIETLLLLLRADMWIKAGATHATFAQMARLNLFLQHDMKNIAQFIQFMADQLAAIPAGKEQQVLDHLRSAAPLIRHRADRIVRTLMAGQPQSSQMRTIQLREELEQLCRLHRLECHISGNAEIHMPENTLDSALDNILKNYSDIAQHHNGEKPVIEIGIAENAGDIEITVESQNTPAAPRIERLFEPFWSSHPAGLGIGLYQARQMLEACGGTLVAGQTESGRLRFRLGFPRMCGLPEHAPHL